MYGCKISIKYVVINVYNIQRSFSKKSVTHFWPCSIFRSFTKLYFD